MSENVKVAVKKRSNFSLDYEHITTSDFGRVVPAMIKEMIPSDSFNGKVTSFIRLAPLATPTFGKIHGYLNYFFVPSRILMPEDSFEQSISGGSDGRQPEEFPFITYAAIREFLDGGIDSSVLTGVYRLFSYFGLGKLYEWIANDMDTTDAKYDTADYSISLLPFLAYARVIADYYFPYGLEDDEIPRQLMSRKYKGLYTKQSLLDDPTIIYSLVYVIQVFYACFKKDYFTSAFVSTQRGGTSVVNVDVANSSQNPAMENYADNQTSAAIYRGSNDKVGLNSNGPSLSNATSVIGRFSAHIANYTQKVQQYLERNNIAGGRFFEQMFARFGVTIPAERLQRSEYLNGNDFYVQVSDVTSTSATTNASLGEQAGKGIALGDNGFSYSAKEHGFIICLMHLVPDTGYVDGIDRMFMRHSRFDYFTPELEQSGLRVIKNCELAAVESLRDNRPFGVFGYAPQFSEYKYSNDILSGDFEDDDPMLNSMHLFRRFEGVPSLNRDFCKCDPDDGFDRIFQNTDTSFDHFFVDFQIKLDGNRPMLGFAESALEFTEQENGDNYVNVPYGGLRL